MDLLQYIYISIHSASTHVALTECQELGRKERREMHQSRTLGELMGRAECKQPASSEFWEHRVKSDGLCGQERLHREAAQADLR